MNPAPTAQIIKYVGLDVHAQTIAVAGRTVADKVPAIVLPITALVAGGFEHSVANMCFIPMDIFLREHVAAAGAANHDVLNWMSLARNLAPVTLGNLVGGAGMVGLVYWVIYRRGAAAASHVPLEK